MTLNEEIAAVREAIASGALEVRVRQNGVEKFVRYASFQELRERLNWLLSQQPEGIGNRRKNVGYAEFKRG